MRTPSIPFIFCVSAVTFVGCSEGAPSTNANSSSGGASDISGASGGADQISGSGGASMTTGGNGGVLASGGSVASGGAVASGGQGDTATGGSNSVGSGGDAGSGGDSGSGVVGPCDIYESASTPCVGAHSTVRALYGAYSGALYQVRRGSDGTTKDISLLSPGGYVDASQQDDFCAGTSCTISMIYDQSPQANHLSRSPVGGWLNNPGIEADATKAPIKINGHTAYGVYTYGDFDNDIGGVGYRNNQTQGVATGDEPEAMYMVADGKHFNQWCCFDYGNAETNNLDNGPATMETIYFGSSTQWGKGAGDTGPWIMADLEDGLFAGSSFDGPDTATPLNADYVTLMLKGHSGNRFALKGGDAQQGALDTKYDGPRPQGYSPQLKEGAIILGTGGDNSHTGEGTFFEGCITYGVPGDDVDDEIQANIVAAGYGK